ncbi:MAG TPA: hypothetical protein VJA19_05510, partial [Pseudomonas sp.]|nr:hypothetical protein [Pseudomonas sp.]
MQVVLEAISLHGQPRWQVRMGRRVLNFHEELAARSFAAQLHQRLEWLRQQAEQPNGTEQRPV